MALTKRQDIESNELKGVVLAVDETKIKPGIFVRLSNWKPTGIGSIQKKRGVAALSSVAITPPTPTEDCTQGAGETAPTAPSVLTATTDSFFQIDLAWTDNSANESHFSIERCSSTGCTNFLQIAIVPANTVTYSDTTLEAGTTYAYRVRAYNIAGVSSYSNTAEATTDALPATPPGVDLALWLDAAQIPTLVDGDPVSTWLDESGGGSDFTATLTTRPTFRENVINSLQAVYFDGVDDVMLNSNLDTSAWTGATVFMVGKIDNDPPVLTSYSGHWKFNAYDNNAHYPATDGVVYENAFTTARKTIGDPPTSLTLAHQYNVTSQNGSYTVRLDKTTIFTTATNTFVGQNGGNRIGGSETYFYKGYIAELIIFEGVLSALDRGIVEAYLELKWGL